MSMLKTAGLALALAVVAVAASAVAQSPPPDPGAPEEDPLANVKIDPREVHLVFFEMNAMEAKLAGIALLRSSHPGVRGYAEKMIALHGQAARKVLDYHRYVLRDFTYDDIRAAVGANAAPQSGDHAFAGGGPFHQMVSDHTAELSRMSWDTPDAEFDAFFVEGQVFGHTMVLRLLDEQLIPAATDPMLREDLEAARDETRLHLNEAQRLLDQVKGAPAGDQGQGSPPPDGQGGY